MTTAVLPRQLHFDSGPTDRRRVKLLDMHVDAVGPSDAEEQLSRFAARGTHHQVVTVNLDFLAIGCRHPEFLNTVNSAALVVPDGTPVLWALRRHGHRVSARVTGPDLVEMAVRHSQIHQSSLYFLGGAEGTAQTAAHELQKRLGVFHLAGVSAPVVTEDLAQNAAIARRVRDARPDFVFVGLGCPKQDLWIRRHCDILDKSVCVGVGGTFSYLSGVVRRAPEWAQRDGLEWAFRVMSEPRRLGMRYASDLPVLLRLAREVLSASQLATNRLESTV